MNVNKSFWLWVKSFLSGRTQQVKINQTLSSIEGFPAGVPQGSANAIYLVIKSLVWENAKSNDIFQVQFCQGIF